MSPNQVNSVHSPRPVENPFTDAWSRYWASGAPHSCVGTYGQRYGGSIGEFWKQVFSSVRSGERILDIATGNGALPRLFLDHGPRHGAQCDAIDVATIAPAWLSDRAVSGNSRLRFHGGVDAARLPFEKNTFDWVCSQYGIEYSDLSLAIPEVCRVAKIGGRVAIMAHHAQSRPVALARIEVGHLEWLLSQSGFLHTVSALVEPMVRASTAEGRASLEVDEEAIRLRDHFNALLGELARKAQTGDGSEVLLEARDRTMALLANAGNLGLLVASAQMTSALEAFQGAWLRLTDLTTHALDECQARAVSEQLSLGIGRVLRLAGLQDEGHMMGWTLRSID